VKDNRLVFVSRALHEVVKAFEVLETDELDGLNMIIDDVVLAQLKTSRGKAMNDLRYIYSNRLRNKERWHACIVFVWFVLTLGVVGYLEQEPPVEVVKAVVQRAVRKSRSRRSCRSSTRSRLPSEAFTRERWPRLRTGKR